MIAVWSAAQIQGSRDYQEDRYAVVENNTILYRGKAYPFEAGLFPARYSLYVLADGMGGMGHGDEAASTVVEVFVESFINFGNQDLNPGERLQASLDRANQAIADIVDREPAKNGMGATLIALLWDRQNSTVQWLSVGDSLLSLLRSNTNGELTLEELNEKHTFERLASRMAEQGDRDKAAELGVLGGTLSSAVDGRPIPEVDLQRPIPIHDQDLVILASDGLETLSVPQVVTTLANYRADWQQAETTNQGTKVVTVCRQLLFDRLQEMQSPYQDNCTLILIGWLATTTDNDQPRSS